METPPLVRKARALSADRLPADRAPDDLGELVHVLAARRGLTRVAAIGSAEIVLAAWIVSALPPQTPFFCVEADAASAAAASELFADDPNVTVLRGPWQTHLSSSAPFDLLAVAEPEPAMEAVVGLLAPGAMVVVVTSGRDPQTAGGRLGHPLLVGTTVRLNGERAVFVAVRR